MDVGTPLVASPESTVLVEPGERSLDDPSEGAQSAAVWCSSFRDVWLDAARAEFLSMWLRVVSTIGVDAVRSLSWAAAFAAHRRDRVHEWE